MSVETDNDRVRHSRRLVLELLGSSVEMGLAGPLLPDGTIAGYMERYGADPARFGPPAPASAAGERDRRTAGHHHAPDGATAETVAQPVKVDNALFVRDYARCILCYKCVEACGIDAQNTFAISVAGRGFDARVSTEFDTPLDTSACVFCGNCINVCPTGALMFRSEFEMRGRGHLGRVRADGRRHDLPLLRRGLHALAPRPGQPDREGALAARLGRHAGQPVREGPLRVRLRAGSPEGLAARVGLGGRRTASGRASPPPGRPAVIDRSLFTLSEQPAHPRPPGRGGRGTRWGTRPGLRRRQLAGSATGSRRLRARDRRRAGSDQPDRPQLFSEVESCRCCPLLHAPAARPRGGAVRARLPCVSAPHRAPPEHRNPPCGPHVPATDGPHGPDRAHVSFGTFEPCKQGVPPR